MFALEVKWCADHGIPHSQLLEWDPSDRSKLMAHLLDAGQKCPNCGSSQWEWVDDPFAYEAGQHMCKGCMILDAAREEFNPGPGVSMVLLPKKKAQKQQGR